MQDQTGGSKLTFGSTLGEEAYINFKKLDTGDIIGVEGTLFKTKTGEITIRAGYEMISKAFARRSFTA